MSTTSAPTTDDLALPVAAIVCIAVVCYTILVIGVLVIRWIIRRTQACENCGQCECCGTEGPLESRCCANVSEKCDCDPSLNKCLNKICPNRKTIDKCCSSCRNFSCVDILLCQCMASENNCCTNTAKTECCVCPTHKECQPTNLCCFEVTLRTTTSVRHEHGLHTIQPSSARHSHHHRSSGHETIVQTIEI